MPLLDLSVSASGNETPAIPANPLKPLRELRESFPSLFTERSASDLYTLGKYKAAPREIIKEIRVVSNIVSLLDHKVLKSSFRSISSCR